MIFKKAGNRTARISSAITLASIGLLAVALQVMSPAASLAQETAPAKAPVASGLDVPTTKILAIGSFTAKATPNVWKPFLPAEARATTELYLDGKIDQWFLMQDHSGVVFILNVTDPAEAHALLDKLPLGQAGLMKFQLIPLGPLSPLRVLFSEPKK
jgi:hypothetical protein